MNMDREILERYVKGNATKSEREAVLLWAASSPENSWELERLRADLVFDHLPSTPVPEYALKRFRKEIQKSSVEESDESADANDSSSSRISTGRSQGNILTIIAKVAAVLFIPLLAFSLYQSVRLNEVRDEFVAISGHTQGDGEDSLVYNVHTGVKGLVDLPDGSKVWLNSGSSVRCPARFARDQRDVVLEGEGYFIVKGDPEWPMLVRTKRNITVKVTGTEFNLSSYENDSEFKLTLVKGNVTILNSNNNTETVVTPMEEIVIPDRASIRQHKQQADIHVSTAWKEGFLLFDNTPMEQVIKRMERWYGVSFIIKDSSILNNNFTAEFKSESLSQVLDFIRKSSFIGYKIDETTVTLSKL